MKKIILKVDGMTCAGCSSGLEKYLNSRDGIISASVNLVLGEALIEYEDYLSVSDLERFIKERGFRSLGVYDIKEDKKRDNKKLFLIIFGILTLLVLYISMGEMIRLSMIPFLNMNNYPINYTLVLFFLAILFIVYGRDIFINGIKNIFYKVPNMDTLVSLGVSSSFLYSLYNMILVLQGREMYVHNLYFESCAVIIFFIKLGRYIDGKSKEKTKEALKELVQITPSSALIKDNDNFREVTIDEVKKGDILICKPGMKIAVDGIIIKGEAYCDEAFITGEAIPRKKNIDDKVVAGSINLDGYIEYKAEKIGKDSMISEIVELVRESSNTKTKIERIADVVSRYFTLVILIIALLTFIVYMLIGGHLSEAISSFVTVLVVACPCALGLATPLSIVVSEGICAKNGILVKKSEILENAYKIDTVVFDKTGTITCGNLRVSKIFNYSNYNDNELMKLVVSLEEGSNHPIAKALVSYGEENNIKSLVIDKFENLSGIGVKGIVDGKEIYLGNRKLFPKLKIKNTHEKDEDTLTKDGNSIVYVIFNKEIIGLIGISDIVREDAKKVIEKLKNMKKEVIMLSGDNEKVASRVGKYVGIDNVIADVLPSDKVNVIKKLTREGKKVMMVGDGINDAPSLATSMIGVSIGSGTDIAGDSSDVILMNDKLSKIISLLLISKKTMFNIFENLFWAFFYNILMIPSAIGLLKPLGISMNPMLAGIAMTLSSLTVVFNALRLKRYRDDWK